MPDVPQPALAPGDHARKGATLQGGRYRLEEPLGRGATADVWRVTDTSLEVVRALKLLNIRASGSAGIRRRLLAEARTMAGLRHPNILRVYDVGTQDDRDFVVMDLADHGSLADWLGANGPMPPDLALVYGIQVLSALQAAHSRGIVHRDVKPQNVLLDQEGNAVLADFGIALLAEDQLRATRTGVAMGSLAFMAPEQRLDARSVTAAADIYAVGTTLYNLLTTANPVDLFAASADSGRWDGIPTALAQVLRRASSYAPADRYGSALELAKALSALLEDASSLPLQTPADAPMLPRRAPTVYQLSPPDADYRPSKESLNAAMTRMTADSSSDISPLALDPLLSLPSVHGATAVADDPQDDPQDDALLALPLAVRWGTPARTTLLVALLAVVGMVGLGWWSRDSIQPATTGHVLTPQPIAEDSVTAAKPSAETALGAAPDDPAPAAQDPAVPTADEAPGSINDVESSDVSSEALAVTPQAPATSSGAAATASDPDPDPDPEQAPVAMSLAAGTWRGNVHVQEAKLVLTGSDQHLSGFLTTTHPATRVSRTVAVHGSYSALTHSLTLTEDLDPAVDPTAGRYQATITDDGGVISGSYHALVGQREAKIKLLRSGA